MITISFEHPEVKAPQYKFGDKVAVKDDCPPKNWLTGEVVGMVLETESYSPRWWYSIKLDAPHGLTEEYLEDDVTAATEIVLEQAEWEHLEANPTVQESNHYPLSKFEPGMRVKLNSRCGLGSLLDIAVVVSSKYVTSEYWSGWTYELINENLTSPVSIGEIWLELVPSTTHSLAVEQPSVTK